MTSLRIARTGAAALAGIAVAVLPALPATAQSAVANDFSITLSSTAESIHPGQSVKVNVETRITEGSAQSVTLSASGLPAGATAAFTPATLQTGDWATLLITTTASTPGGAAQVTITADGADIDRTATFTLTTSGGGNPPGGCDGIAAWAAQTSYTPGALVSHNGRKWESTWYSTGAEPGAAGSWAVWKDLGAC